MNIKIKLCWQLLINKTLIANHLQLSIKKTHTTSEYNIFHFIITGWQSLQWCLITVFYSFWALTSVHPQLVWFGLITGWSQLCIWVKHWTQFICSWFDLDLLMVGYSFVFAFSSEISLSAARLIWTRCWWQFCVCLEQWNQFICGWFDLNLLFVWTQTMHLILNSLIWIQQLA